jgi:hypothetical protein
MKLFNRKIYKLLKPLQAVSLSVADKKAIKNQLIAKLGLNPASEPTTGLSGEWWQWRGMVLVGVVVLMLGSGIGISTAAEGALPGDWLYAVKTKIKEPLGRTLVKTHSNASAAFELNLLHKRLSEAEKLLADDRLSEVLEESIKLEIDKQTAKAVAQTTKTTPDNNNTGQPEELPKATKIETEAKPAVMVEVDVSQVAEEAKDNRDNRANQIKNFNELMEEHQDIIDKLEIKFEKLNKSADPENKGQATAAAVSNDPLDRQQDQMARPRLPAELPGLPTNKPNQKP